MRGQSLPHSPEPRDKIRSGWSKKRFTWKEQIHATRKLSRGAKFLASRLCDQYAGRNTGRCWPSNGKIARAQGCSERTVQRHVRELIDAEWIKILPSSKHKRLLELTFPSASHVCHDDKIGAVTMTETSLSHDITVTPYYKEEPSKKPNKEAFNKSLRVVRIEMCEKSKISAWEDWINANFSLSWETLAPMLRKGETLNLPCQYPESDETEEQAYQLFFERAFQSQGKCFA